MKIFETMRVAARKLRDSHVLTVEEQFEQVERQVMRENEQQHQMLRNLHPAGFHKLVRHDGSFIALRHWCPDCKTLAMFESGQSAAVKHCKRTDTFNGSLLNLLFLPEEKSLAVPIFEV